MERVVILGRGGAGKSTVARKLGDLTGLPVIELDKEFWDDQLRPLAPHEWSRRQEILAEGGSWIMDGDLGPYDELEPRLARADTVVLLDMPLLLCAWRVRRRGRERRDFWSWTIRWPSSSRPRLLAAIAQHTSTVSVVCLNSPRSVRQWLASVRR